MSIYIKDIYIMVKESIANNVPNVVVKSVNEALSTFSGFPGGLKTQMLKSFLLKNVSVSLNFSTPW